MLVRHAKTEASHASGDHARALVERGQRDAKALGAWLKDETLLPDLVLCSTAVRARQTLTHMCITLPTQLSDNLYLAEAEELLATLSMCDDAHADMMLIGHNPGLHALVVALMRDATHEEDVHLLAEKFPTSTIAVLEVSLAHWTDLRPHSATLTHLHSARA
jgi:phosphohistidine phosphatase